ncbi:MAG TPA: DNA-processing protein DprA [Bacilli bacterium]|nr:DNA-processing protein DprA [Bacilli bacterium]
MREQDIFLWLCTTRGVGGVTIRRLYNAFGEGSAIWQAEADDMVQVAGIRLKAAQELVSARVSFDPYALRREYGALGIRFLAYVDEEYPAILRELYDPPGGLFVLGDLPPCAEQALAVVGSRKPTIYGRNVTQKLVGELAEQGLTIVSGLARGIDTIAHEAALQAGGQTLAVLGSGLQQIYPRENLRLAHRIADGHGAVVSEFHPMTPGKPSHFPIRNRIISGLSQATLVIEAGAKSGSLITSDQALEQGRDVYAIPGPIYSPQSEGTNRLIQQGAKLVQTAPDILEDYGFVAHACSEVAGSAVSPVNLPPEAQVLFEALGYQEATVDQLLLRTGWESGELHTWLLKLQVQGHLTALPGGRYIRTPSN